MLLIYFIDIFEDNHNIVCDFFKTFSKCDEKMLLVAQGNINLSQSHHKPWKLSLGTTTFKTCVSLTRLRQTVEKLLIWESIGVMPLVI